MPTGRDLIATAQQAVPKTTTADLNRQLTSGGNVIVLDIRELEEWDGGHIPQGTHLSRGRLEGRVEELIPDKSTPIVTH